MSTSGPNGGSSATTSGSGNDWTNPNNVLAQDTSYCTCQSVTVATQKNLNVTGFGFAIPNDAIINGIKVEIGKFRSGGTLGNVIDSNVQLIIGGVATGANNASGSNWGTSIAFSSYGSASYLWGLTPTVSNINASDFGATIAIKGDATSDRVANVDYVRITITYTQSTGIANSIMMMRVGI